MENPEATAVLLRELKEAGFQVYLDDFGTGYSSLNYLRRLPFDNLKIDRLFVEGITSNSHNATIVKAIIALAHNLNLRVIAEGVETVEELDFLQTNECDEIQGYYFSKPLPQGQLLDLLEDGRF
jgi:EAL domain-containing protein (putative c-di-GMP-specific phosphodiesterase class I)